MGEPDTGLITGCAVEPGNGTDTDAAVGLLEHEPAGIEVLGDSAYGTGEFRNHLNETGRQATIKPPPLRTAVEGGFSLDDFTINTNTVTCPEGHTVTITSSRTARFGAHCHTCPVRHLCTRAKGGRTIKVHPHHTLLAAARTQADTDEFTHTYSQHRPMIERTIAWCCRQYRRCRYRGIERNQLGWSHRCAAINLTRLINLGINHTGTHWATT